MSTRSKYCCPTCGHPVLPDDPLALLSPSERAIFDVIYRAGQAGIRREAVHERVYGNAPNGATSDSIVSVHVSRINKKMRWLGMEIYPRRDVDLGKEVRYTVRRLPHDLSTREETVCAS